MFEKFYPYEYVDSSYNIDYQDLYDKGYRGLLFDIDNTLVEHGADANEKAIDFLQRLRKMGFRICFISNNDKERVLRFNRRIKAKCIYKAKKPSVKSYRRAMRLMGTKKNTTVFIGDQIFTDIYGANQTGLRTYLVKPIGKKEEIQIVLKRYLESIVLFFYRRDRLSKSKPRIKVGKYVAIQPGKQI